MSQSIVLYFLNKIYKVEGRLESILNDSMLFKFAFAIFKRLKVYCEGCFLGVIVQVRFNYCVLEESKVVSAVLRLHKRIEGETELLFRTGCLKRLSRHIEEGLYHFPVKLISAIVVIAILINISLSLIFNCDISTWNRVMFVLFLAAGIIGLSCDAEPTAVKNGSIVFKIFKWFKRS